MNKILVITASMMFIMATTVSAEMRLKDSRASSLRGGPIIVFPYETLMTFSDLTYELASNEDETVAKLVNCGTGPGSPSVASVSWCSLPLLGKICYQNTSTEGVTGPIECQNCGGEGEISCTDP